MMLNGNSEIFLFAVQWLLISNYATILCVLYTVSQSGYNHSQEVREAIYDGHPQKPVQGLDMGSGLPLDGCTKMVSPGSKN